ncbi:MAG TPA: hemerythrin domain-containing protein [Candidatus Stackebrandtia excrementipullorum]|nr:hemerythrin domain-containing protein [Candidatus Stackebrandtia excrementipullorum]
MAEGEETRLIAWSSELRNVHQRLREALNIAQEALESGESNDTATRDLLLYCRGFCTALTRHHEGEDRELFPAIAAAYPQLRETLEYLERDHAMIAHLVNRLETVIATASPSEVAQHLDGIAAIMESHFAYEERKLLTVLETLELDTDPRTVLGPL